MSINHVKTQLENQITVNEPNKNGEHTTRELNCIGNGMQRDCQETLMNLTVHKPDILRIQETKLSNSRHLPSVQGYAPDYFQHRTEGQGVD